MTPDPDDYTPELPPLDAYHDLDDPGPDTPAANGHKQNGHTPAAHVEPRPGDGLGALADGHRPTDAGNADRLAARITRPAVGHDANGLARWIPKWGKWIVYLDGAWRLDDGDALITEQAKAVARALFSQAATLTGDDRDAMWKWAKRSESSAAVASMVRLCRGTVRVDHGRLDQHPWLLNVANGTIDLRTGELRDPDPEDLLTCQSPVSYDAQATAPTFQACLQTWQPDPDVRSYLQRIAGVGATGHPTETVVVNLGPGGNGKGKFWGALQDVLGPDYAVVPHKTLIVVQRHDQHDTVKARLFGARLAVAGETEAGDRLDEAKVKELTGGDLLEARRMREDPWKFAPTHTLVLHTNHRPRVRGGDEGIWRRLRLIPWETVIAPADRDTRLAERLRQEAPGILNWIIAGAAAWLADGDQPPETVLAATRRYREDEDHVGRFLRDACATGPDGEPDPNRQVTVKRLREAYEEWCDAIGDQPWSATALGRELGARGYDSTRTREAGGPTARYWIGLDVLAEDGEPRQQEAF